MIIPGSPISPNPSPAATTLPLLLARARHDLQNSMGHILGFSDMLLEELEETGHDRQKQQLQSIKQTASQLLNQVNELFSATALTPALPHPMGEGELLKRLEPFKQRLCHDSQQIIALAEALAQEAPSAPEGVFKSDLGRIAGAARHAQVLLAAALACLAQSSRPGDGSVSARPAPADWVSTRFQSPPAAPAPKHGSILVVDDLEENRELLSRRLSRLGYSVVLVESGTRALEIVSSQPPDLILLDILMPDLDGFEVLQRLKADPTTRHIPVIMLSSADQIDTVVRCINLGADDFLPKPFNATLLMARIESSLSKKRLRDQETAFLKQLQAEQDTSERLLLNILPRPIADRLKQGEQTIADSFENATVLFSDFVGFTKLSAGIVPRELVRRLNEIFSAFDRLCENHHLEKIKMIGDGYMVVGGLPTPRADHAAATADLALDMQREVNQSGAADGARFRLRIGINSGPVVAGVIGTKKFAYDLWGDTVNLASRMERHAPAGGILVTSATYEHLRTAYTFRPGRVIRVKGKGEVLTYLLLGKV